MVGCQVAFENTRTVLGITNGPVRSAIKGALMSKGFRAVTDVTTMVQLHEILEQDCADLIITTSKLGYDDATLLIREMRYNRLGHNPFVNVIMLLEAPDKEELVRVVNAGVDDVLLMPISPSQLFTRIDTIKRARKQFIFAHDYIGPDRRKEERPGAQPPTVFDPPNPLKLRDETVIDEGRFQAHIRSGLMIYRRLLLSVQTRQVEWLAGQIAIGCRDTAIPVKETATNCARLVNAGQDIGKRLTGDEYVEALGISTGMVTMARQVGQDPRAASIEMLTKLTEAAKDLKARFAAPNQGAAPSNSKSW
jgi:DNA-binding response OmpR family regulator